jgi:hypothetical protein
MALGQLAPSAARCAGARRGAAGRASRRAATTLAAAAPAAPRPKLRRLGDSDLMVHEICLARLRRGCSWLRAALQR